ncbi:MAG: M56 family metallopeptidase [Phycisphaerales bacterium]|nr:MAG: M56 family metallopeptidase [Phycisphaerales bacterium]
MGALNSCHEPVAAIETEVDAPALIPSGLVRQDMWGRWWAGLLAIRDAAGQLPPLPPWFWLSGVGALVVLWVLQALALASRTARARPAPNPVRRMVVEAAKALGLSRVPKVFMLEAPVAPMIWCLPLLGGPRLILPVTLWSQLDERGRRAVVYHELAHLRRRDHWVRWIEVAVGAVYWWHPLVWWVRRHLQEEAELSCDAWVTWLMPKARRTYAEALVHARQVADSRGDSVSAVALAFTSRRSKTFARRLTMVMTESVRPKSSFAALAVVVALAVAGWMVMPAWAYPPKGKCKEAAKASAASKCDAKPGSKGAAVCDKSKVAQEIRADRLVVVPRVPAPPAAAAAPCPPDVVMPLGGQDPGLALALGALPDAQHVYLAGSGDEDLEARLERLERLVEQLAKRLGAAPDPRPRPKAPPAPPAPPARLPPPAQPPAFVPGEQVVRAYSLSSAGKLKDLTQLMARPDVPVLISPGEDAIEVHGTEVEHAIFKAFVDMIDPKEGSKGTEEVAARLRDLLQGKALYLRPGACDPEEAGGLEARRRVFDAQVLMLEGQKEAFERQRGALKEAIELEREALREALEEQRESLHGAVEAELDSMHGEREAMEEHRAEFERERRELREERRQLERERRELERMRRQLERSRERDKDRDEETL